jgi:DNA-binding CsgD family transcriptional regulator
VAASELSLDAPLDRGDRDSSSFGERFAGAEAEEIEEEVESQARREFLERMFEKYLTERERKILYLYYGLDEGEERTLEEIGMLLGVTRERIRQIRNRAFEKLRESPDGAALEGSGRSMFMHGSWEHLIGNMLFLWVFGNNIEDSMGHLRFIVFYLACGVAAALAHVYLSPTSSIPRRWARAAPSAGSWAPTWSSTRGCGSTPGSRRSSSSTSAPSSCSATGS